MNPKIFDDEEMVDETMRETAGTLQEIASFMAGNKEKGNSETLELAAKLLFACSEVIDLSWDDVEAASRVAQDRYNFGIGEE